MSKAERLAANRTKSAQKLSQIGAGLAGSAMRYAADGSITADEAGAFCHQLADGLREVRPFCKKWRHQLACLAGATVADEIGETFDAMWEESQEDSQGRKRGPDGRFLPNGE
jgi:hypothetical protein